MVAHKRDGFECLLRSVRNGVCDVLCLVKATPVESSSMKGYRDDEGIVFKRVVRARDALERAECEASEWLVQIFDTSIFIGVQCGAYRRVLKVRSGIECVNVPRRCARGACGAARRCVRTPDALTRGVYGNATSAGATEVAIARIARERITRDASRWEYGIRNGGAQPGDE